MRSRVQCLGRGVSKGASRKRRGQTLPLRRRHFLEANDVRAWDRLQLSLKFRKSLPPSRPPRPAAPAPTSPFALLVSPGDDKEPITVIRKKLTTTSG